MGIRKGREGSKRYAMHDGEEMYRYNMVVPVRVWLLLREVAIDKNQTIVGTLTQFIREGYRRWQEEKEAGEKV